MEKVIYINRGTEEVVQIGGEEFNIGRLSMENFLLLLSKKHALNLERISYDQYEFDRLIQEYIELEDTMQANSNTAINLDDLPEEQRMAEKLEQIWQRIEKDSKRLGHTPIENRNVFMLYQRSIRSNF